MKTRKLFLPLVVLLWYSFSAIAQPAHIGDSIGHMLVQHSPKNQWHSGQQDSCWELISFPDDYDQNPTKNYPVLFFFHGAGEAGAQDGSQLSRQLNNALPQFISQGLKPSALGKDGKLYKFIVVCPQAIGGSSDINFLYYILPDILKKVRADTTRLYITGLSYGGYGTWSCLTDNAASPFQGFIHHFAAILPQSQVGLDLSINTGTATGYNRVAHVKDAAADSLPVLIVCGDADDKWQYSKAYRDSINNHNPYIPAILIDRPGQGHAAGAWDSIYSPTFRPPDIGGMNGYEWLIQYTNTRGYLTGVTSVPPPPVTPGPPSANAGVDQTITLPTSSVTLTGSGSETNGTITSYTWSQTGGPTTATIATPGQAQTGVSNLAQGTYTFQLKVKDNSGVTATDVMTVTVKAAPVVPGPPSANAGSNQTITLPTSSVTLTGSGSETNGTIVGYAWLQTAGPTTATVATPGQAQTGVSNLAEGIYRFQLTVTDNSGVTATASVQVTVKAAPVVPGPPSANAGSDQNITLPASSVTLTGSGSETNGTIVGYAWLQTGGPTTATIGTAGQAQTGVSNLAQGVYTFQLKVTDNSGVTATDVVTVTVNPAIPVPGTPSANAGSNQAITLPANSVTLTGSGSETNGTIVGYAWLQTGGPTTATIATPGQAQTGISNMVQGVYRFQLTVTDNSGVTATASVQVTVNAAPVVPGLPSANAGSDQTITLPTSNVTLTGSGSESNGTIAGYAWLQTGGPTTATISTAGQAQTGVSNLAQGVYTFQLKVTDNSGVTATDVVTVTVKAAPTPNQAPVAIAGPDQSVDLPATVTLDGSASYDPDGSIVKYSWMQVSGLGGVSIGSSATAKATVYGLQPGVYAFRLTVTDNDGATDTSEVTITVPAGNQTLLANAGLTDTVALPATQTILNGALSSTATGSIVSYTWEQESGPQAANLTNPDSVYTLATSLIAGNYVFKLTVKDNNGNESSSEVTVVVLPNNQRYVEDIKLYPNPAHDVLNFQYQSDKNEKISIFIFDVKGSRVLAANYEKESAAFSSSLNVSGLGRGVYTFEIVNAAGKKTARLFVKQ